MVAGPPSLVLVHGSDTQLLDDVLAAADAALFHDPGEAILDRAVLDGRETGVATVVDAARTVPVVARRRLVAVRHAQGLPAKGSDAVAAYARAPSPSACVLLLADEPLPPQTQGRKAHWLLEAMPAALVVPLPQHKNRALEKWLCERALQEGLSVTLAAARRLVELAGEDGAALLGAVRKAALAGGVENRAVGLSEIEAIVGETKTHGVFDLTRAVERADLGTAQRLLDALLGSEEPVPVLALITREVRTGWTIRERLRQGRSPDEIAHALRRPAGAVRAMAPMATAIPREVWAARLRRCWDVEWRLKSGGEAKAELAALVADLCRR